MASFVFGPHPQQIKNVQPKKVSQIQGDSLIIVSNVIRSEVFHEHDVVDGAAADAVEVVDVELSVEGDVNVDVDKDVEVGVGVNVGIDTDVDDSFSV